MEVGKMKKERGFTLIELLVVIAILTILFGVTALLLTNVGNNAKQETARAEADMVQTAIDVWITADEGAPVATTCEQVGPASSGFGAYLRRSSRFYFGWDANGNVTGAYDDAACGSQLWP
jgi:prepilin-type N-terminal cleavage/methylation domain-containing protein